MKSSTKTPAKAEATKAPKSANIKDPVNPAMAAATKPPIIKSDPWARFIKPITPKIKVNPAAIKNNMTPN